MKTGKAAGFGGCVTECLTFGLTIIVEWLMRLVGVCFHAGEVSVDWMCAWEVPLYKINSGRYECLSFRSINLLSVIRKLYGK